MKDLRETYLKPEFKDKYRLLEQALFDDIMAREMDTDALEGNVGAVANKQGGGEEEGEDQREPEYEPAEIWAPECNCWAEGLAREAWPRGRG